MTDPLLSNVSPLIFGEQSISSGSFLAPDITSLPVIKAVKASVPAGLKPGWHTAVITFELDENGAPVRLGEYKVSSFGKDQP
jgi:hypothetical protein